MSGAFVKCEYKSVDLYPSVEYEQKDEQRVEDVITQVSTNTHQLVEDEKANKIVTVVKCSGESGDYNSDQLNIENASPINKCDDDDEIESIVLLSSLKTEVVDLITDVPFTDDAHFTDESITDAPVTDALVTDLYVTDALITDSSVTDSLFTGVPIIHSETLTSDAVVASKLEDSLSFSDSNTDFMSSTEQVSVNHTVLIDRTHTANTSTLNTPVPPNTETSSSYQRHDYNVIQDLVDTTPAESKLSNNNSRAFRQGNFTADELRKLLNMLAHFHVFMSTIAQRTDALSLGLKAADFPDLSNGKYSRNNNDTDKSYFGLDDDREVLDEVYRDVRDNIGRDKSVRDNTESDTSEYFHEENIVKKILGSLMPKQIKPNNKYGVQLCSFMKKLRSMYKDLVSSTVSLQNSEGYRGEEIMSVCLGSGNDIFDFYELLHGRRVDRSNIDVLLQCKEEITDWNCDDLYGTVCESDINANEPVHVKNVSVATNTGEAGVKLFRKTDGVKRCHDTLPEYSNDYVAQSKLIKIEKNDYCDYEVYEVEDINKDVNKEYTDEQESSSRTPTMNMLANNLNIDVNPQNTKSNMQDLPIKSETSLEISDIVSDMDMSEYPETIQNKKLNHKSVLHKQGIITQENDTVTIDDNANKLSDHIYAKKHKVNNLDVVNVEQCIHIPNRDEPALTEDKEHFIYSEDEGDLLKELKPVDYDDDFVYFNSSEEESKADEREEKRQKKDDPDFEGSNSEHGESNSDAEHSDYNEYLCNLCEMDFPSQAALNEHTKTAHHTNFTCYYCERSFPTAGVLRSHEGRMHQNEKRLCGECGELCENLKSYRLHEKERHNPFRCPICDRAFSRKRCLDSHAITHQEDRKKEYVCQTCGMQFYTTYGLRSHALFKHNAGDDKLCHHCAHGFKNLSHLRRHVREVHVNFRPFMCNVCDKAFANKTNLRVHVEGHERQDRQAGENSGKKSKIKDEQAGENSGKKSKIKNKQAGINTGIKSKIKDKQAGENTGKKSKVKDTTKKEKRVRKTTSKVKKRKKVKKRV